MSVFVPFCVLFYLCSLLRYGFKVKSIPSIREGVKAVLVIISLMIGGMILFRLIFGRFSSVVYQVLIHPFKNKSNLNPFTH